MKPLTKSQARSLKGKIKWIDDRVMSNGEMVTLICCHPTAITFLERRGLLASGGYWVATLTPLGRKLLTS